ncbi:MAG: lipocalin family protein [Bacteroidia bacterium]|nr:lipocalin family protein [Bacteroidia bacterium]
MSIKPINFSISKLINLRFIGTLCCVLVLASCKADPEHLIAHLPGYWEVTEVKKDGKLIKAFTMSATVDYFELIDENEGFRKKVNPTLDGTYIVSQHQTPFTINIEEGDLWVNYSDNGVEYKERIIEANDKKLRIKNDAGFIYSYKSYEPITLDK